MTVELYRSRGLIVVLAALPVVIAVVGLWRNELDPMFFTGLVAATVASLLLLPLRQQVREAFRTTSLGQLLHKKGTRDLAEPPTIDAFLGRFRSSFRARPRWLVAALFAICAVPQFFVTLDVDWWALVRAHGIGAFGVLLSSWPAYYVAVLLVLAGVGFALGLFAWRLACVGGYVYALGIEFDARVRAQHPDGAGGWAPIGAVCLANALIIVVPAIDVGLWLALMATVPGARQRYGHYEDWFIVLLLITFSLAVVAFVVPLYGVHRAMLREREARRPDRDAITKQMDRVAPEMRTAATQGKATELDALSKQHGQLLALYESERDLPSWPVDLRVVGSYLVAQLVPLLSVGKVVADFITKRLLGGS
jgi:hypothetical protein